MVEQMTLQAAYFTNDIFGLGIRQKIIKKMATSIDGVAIFFSFSIQLWSKEVI